MIDCDNFKMKQARKYVDPAGKEPFNLWFKQLPESDQMRVDAYIARVLRGGSKKNIESVGEGVFEIKIAYGPGFRVYFATDKEMILLTGGTKRTQKSDIKEAKTFWRDYEKDK